MISSIPTEMMWLVAVFMGEAALSAYAVASDYEPSHCRYGVWHHAGRMFCNDAEP
jgi:hypothetical protein